MRGARPFSSLRAAVILGFFVVALSASARERIWLTPEHFDELHVVLAADAPEPEQIAAARFVAHWKLATGVDISQSAEASSGTNVWIGSAALKAFLQSASAETGESIVRTLPGALVLAGGGARATLAAEWAFFEKFLGARAFAPDVLKIPKPERGIPEIDWRGRPAFEYRDTNARPFLTDPWFASLNDLNGQWSNVPDRFGGHIGFVHGLEGHGHTFHQFVSPDE